MPTSMLLPIVLSSHFLLSLTSAAAVQSSHCLSGISIPVSKHNVSLYPPVIEYSGFFSADITVGSQTLRAALDTGSSDTWFVSTETNCTEINTLAAIPPSECGYSGPRYDPGSTFAPIDNTNLNASYGSGLIVLGQMGNTPVEFAGLKVSKQEISAATFASLGGNAAGNVSGLVGLAYPASTNAYHGNDPYQDCKDTTGPNATSCGPAHYSPLLTTIFNDKLAAPIFSFALSRGTKAGGMMSVGGIPHLNDPHVNASTSRMATVPLEPLTSDPSLAVYLSYSSGFHFPGSTLHAGAGQYIFDTGTGINVVPRAQADKINGAFNPPGSFNKTAGLYLVQCNASAPDFGIEFGGTTFYHNPADMILPVPGEDVLCVSAIQSSLSTVYQPILGAPFMKNVLAVFDVGKKEITLMGRRYYRS